MLDLPIFFLSAHDGFPVIGQEFDFTINAQTQENAQIYLDKCKESDEIVIGIYPHPYSKISSLPLEKQFQKIGPVCYVCQISHLEELDETTFAVFSNPTQRVKIENLDFEEKFADMVPIDESSPHTLSSKDAKSVYDFIIYLMDELQITQIEKVRSVLAIESFSEIEKIDLIAHLIISDKAIKYVYNQTIDEEERAKEFVYYLLNTYESVNVLPLSKVASFESPFSSSNRSTTRKKETSSNFSHLPDHVKQKLEKEETRFKRLPPSSLEAQTALDYIETVQSIPWTSKPQPEINLNDFSDELNKTHYGMDDIKSKIQEHIALQIHLNKPIGTIMCFCGPPGTGKTSIAKAIAKSSGKELIKIALGGVTDEAEFRGHRRTYVASKPGRIIEGLIKAKTQDPIVLLDEVDKLSNSAKGDPTSALLEILDPEQNEEFIDRYVEIPVDLSKVTFIATANYIEKIPKPLLDRLDIIEFRFYTEEERTHILQKYMIPKAFREYCLEDFEIVFDPETIIKLVSSKSIRVMEKNLKSILRFLVKSYLQTGQKEFNITPDFLKFNLDTTKTMGFK